MYNLFVHCTTFISHLIIYVEKIILCKSIYCFFDPLRMKERFINNNYTASTAEIICQRSNK